MCVFLLPQCPGKCHTHQQHLTSVDSFFSSKEKMQGILRKITKTNQSAMSSVNRKERWREPGLIFSEKNEKSYREAVEKVWGKCNPKSSFYLGRRARGRGSAKTRRIWKAVMMNFIRKRDTKTRNPLPRGLWTLHSWGKAFKVGC